MGADAFTVYFGIRFTVPEAEIEALEREADPRLIAARKVKLRCCLDRLTDGDPHFLLIGHEFGSFGVEGDATASITEDEMQRIVSDTKRKLRDAGFEQPPAFHFQFIAQY